MVRLRCLGSPQEVALLAELKPPRSEKGGRGDREGECNGGRASSLSSAQLGSGSRLQAEMRLAISVLD